MNELAQLNIDINAARGIVSDTQSEECNDKENKACKAYKNSMGVFNYIFNDKPPPCLICDNPSIINCAKTGYECYQFQQYCRTY